VVVASDEEYYEPLNATLDGGLNLVLGASGKLKNTANARVYAIDPRGRLAILDPPIGPNKSAGAYLPGWPTKVADLEPGLLPTIGDGATASPALARLGASKALTVIASSTAGPIYEFNASGGSALGMTGSTPTVLSQTPATGGLVNLAVPALGAPTIAPIGPPTNAPSIFSAVGSLGKLLDEGYPARQTPNADEIGGWSAITGQLRAGFPAAMNDLQFLTYPVVADVAGVSNGGFVIQGSGLNDLRAYGPQGSVPAGWPKFVGGWVVGGASVGRIGSLQSTVVMVGTREGQLWTWSTGATRCADRKNPGPWPQVHHDLSNSSNLANLTDSSC
jgi:hypothetical protein